MVEEKSAKYHVDHWLTGPYLPSVSNEDLEKWATDPDCIEMDACAKYLAERVAERRAVRAAKREELQDNPFDPRTEVSADARHIAGRIVTHLWILFVLLPFIIGVLLALLGVIK